MAFFQDVRRFLGSLSWQPQARDSDEHTKTGHEGVLADAGDATTGAMSSEPASESERHPAEPAGRSASDHESLRDSGDYTSDEESSSDIGSFHDAVSDLQSVEGADDGERSQQPADHSAGSAPEVQSNSDDEFGFGDFGLTDEEMVAAMVDYERQHPNVDALNQALGELAIEDDPQAGTYAGRDEERKRLGKLGYKVHGTTHSAHLADHVVAFPYPHMRAGKALESERQKAYGLGIAYNEAAALHQRHVGSFYNEKAEGFDKKEHAWKTPAEYRNHARAVLRDSEAKETRTDQPTNLSNTIQMNFLDFAHVQNATTDGAHPLGLYKNESEIQAADNSFKRTIRLNRPVHFIRNDPGKASPVVSLQDERIERQHLSRGEQAEVVLARETLIKRQFPTQQSIERVAKEFLSPTEYNEKQALWKREDNQDTGLPAYDSRSRNKSRER